MSKEKLPIRVLLAALTLGACTNPPEIPRVPEPPIPTVVPEYIPTEAASRRPIEVLIFGAEPTSEELATLIMPLFRLTREPDAPTGVVPTEEE